MFFEKAFAAFLFLSMTCRLPFLWVLERFLSEGLSVPTSFSES